jgi:hypothetical protein
LRNIPLETNAISAYDTLSESDKAALRQVDDIRERLIRRLYVRRAGPGGRIGPREIGDDGMEEARAKATAVLLRLSGLTQEGLEDPDAAEDD